MNDKLRQSLTMREVCALTGYRRGTLRDLVYRGGFIKPEESISGVYLYDREKVMRWWRDYVGAPPGTEMRPGLFRKPGVKKRPPA